MSEVEATVLNAMASTDFQESLTVQRQWGICSLDLKDHIFGKQVEDLSDAEASDAAHLIEGLGLRTYCLTTSIFKGDLVQGKEAYRSTHLRAVERIMEIAGRLQPAAIRILTPNVPAAREGTDNICSRYPWFMPLLQEAVDTMYSGGCQVMIENEPERTVFSSPEEIVRFFRLLDRQGKAYFTYDVQNLWQMGVFPTLQVYRQLRPVIGYVHVKGGIMDPATKLLRWKSGLEESSWPAAEMTREVIRDGSSPVICVNPSHGADHSHSRYAGRDAYKRDYDFVAGLIEEMQGKDAACRN